MIFITSENDYYNLKLYETRKIIENTIIEYVQKYGVDCLKSAKIKCVAEFLDKIENETKL